MRITGLASGMDIDAMVKDMLVGEQEKIDKAKQNQQVTKWKQEIYRDVIKDTKNLYDKYFSITSPNSILSSSNYSTVGINSSNSNVITAIANPGANKINYNFEVKQLAEQPKVSGKITDSDLIAGKEITIKSGNNDVTITIEDGESIQSLSKKINEAFPDGSIKAGYSEMTGEFTISGKDTGSTQTFEISGSFFENGKMKTNNGEILDSNLPKSITGKDLEVNVYDPADLSTPIRETITSQSNSFTIDNITYNANFVGSSTLTGTTDTTKAVENMKLFIDDYNKLMDKTYNLLTEKKDSEFKPLTEEQKKEMTKEEIETWEAKAKKGILRNDRELSMFMDDIQRSMFGALEGIGIPLNKMGITSHSDYNKKNQLNFDADKFSKALIENGELVYESLAKTTTDGTGEGAFEKLKDVVYKYAGNSSSVFAKKAGIEGTSTVANNVYSKEINEKETKVKELARKMAQKEKQLYAKFAVLETNLSKYNNQMGYFMQSMGY